MTRGGKEKEGHSLEEFGVWTLTYVERTFWDFDSNPTLRKSKGKNGYFYEKVVQSKCR